MLMHFQLEWQNVHLFGKEIFMRFSMSAFVNFDHFVFVLNTVLGPVVQSIVSLTSSLRVNSLSVL